MLQLVAMPRVQNFASEELAREIAGRLVRFALVGLGLILVIVGFLIAPLPGPLGLPITVVGLMLVLRNSFRARRQFIRFQRAYPKMAFPLRRLMRREPEVVQVFWQQTLRVERLIIRPAGWRVARRIRRRFFRRKVVAA